MRLLTIIQSGKRPLSPLNRLLSLSFALRDPSLIVLTGASSSSKMLRRCLEFLDSILSMGDTITLLSSREIDKMRRAGRMAAELLDH